MNNPMINQGNPMQMLNQIKQNPIQFLAQRGFNVPQNINNPYDMIQHLMNTGQVSQEKYDNLMRTAQQMGIKK